MAVRTEVLWEAGKQAWTALRQLEFTKKQRKLTGYWERKVADRICEFCLALQVIQQKGKGRRSARGDRRSAADC
jgi:uncharacterized coiled-coil DUF342 family protein